MLRRLIEREHRAAATAYQRFLDENPEERSAMEIWESAPLVDDVEAEKPMRNRGVLLVRASDQLGSGHVRSCPTPRLQPRRLNSFTGRRRLQ